MTSSFVVAVDGPSGSGKSSVCREAALRLGAAYLDTGAMYRSVAWWCLERGVSLEDRTAVAQAARTLPLEMVTDPAHPAVLVDGRDIEDAIRSSAISSVVSKVATNLDVRAILIAEQRRLIDAACAHGPIVAEGRDLTTVVAPDADVRVLLVASEEARLRRRAPDKRDSAVDQHRNLGVREHLVGFAAEQEAGQTAPPVRGHEDQVATGGGRSLDDAFVNDVVGE